jgi:HEAT repeat protein
VINLSENDLEKELLSQLSSKKRSLMIQAIVKLARTGKSKDSLDALLKLVKSPDREVSFFSFQAAGKIAKRLNIDIKELIANNENSSGNLDREQLLNPEPSQIETILTQIRENSENIEESLLPAVAAFLNKYGDKTDASFLKKHLGTNDSNLILPFIDAAEKIAPEVFIESLPQLLASPEPLVRSRAIRSLQRIDSEEAERHFSDLLASPDSEARLAAIGLGFLFPFNRVKSYILALLPEEVDPDVLRACQIFLASNPEIETALGILDSLDTAPVEQKKRLNVIFRTVCQAIKTAKILSDAQAEPEAIVQLWKKQRLEIFLKNLEIQLTFSDDEKKKSIISWIEKNRSHPKVSEFIERLAQNPQTETVYNMLKGFDKPSTSEPASPDSKISTKDSIEKIRNITLDSFNLHKSWLLQLIKAGKPAEKAEALIAMLKLHPDNRLIDLAKEAINNQNVQVKIAAFKIFEKLAPELLQEKITEMLHEDDPGIRIRAARVALKIKPDEAITILKNMLKSEEQRIRANAVACLGLCPFDRVYKILMNQLDTENHPVIARHIASVLVTNPSKFVLKGLDNITRTSNPAIAMIIAQARNELFELVASMPEESEPQAEPEQHEKTPGKPYSVENVRELARARQKIWKPGYKPEKATLKERIFGENFSWSFAISGAIVLFVIAMIPIMFLTGNSDNKAKASVPKDWRAEERKKFNKSKIPEKFRMNRTCSVYATVEKVTSDTSMIVTHEGQKIMIKFDTPEPKNLTPGTELVVTMIPIRVNSQGIIQAKGTSFAVSKGQEN